MFIIKRDELRDAEDEVKVLENLLNEAWERRRKKYFKTKRHTRMVGLAVRKNRILIISN
jgi:hypothetical protein